ncbi:sensor histidine kinase [Agromyces lapidis]|uniref:histidine kinase n=1 Tax=Agromyces lapidis TaxID=279574 RepID=A0ABV5SST6_9MICO|nr:histidine kinase [Agromyces lapidis]
MSDSRSPEQNWGGPPPWAGRPPWNGRERQAPPAAFVLLAPVVISLLVQVPAAIGIAVWQHLDWAAGLLQISLAVAGPLALVASRRYPGPTVAVVSLLALADLVLTSDAGPPYLALAFAIVLAVARGAVIWAAASVVAVWAAALVVGSMLGLTWHPFRIAITTLALAACFGIGWFVRTRRTRAAAYRAEAMRRRQTAEERERVRIARELHDVIGHALSQINVQASVGLHLMDRDAEQARTALAHIKETSKTALEEVRSVLGVIRDGEAPLVPQAELAELPRLVGGLAAPGFAVELDDRLAAPPGRAVQFAAYRIVQEALTNVVRHAEASRAVVSLERSADELLVVIDDDGDGFAGDGADAATEGRGILGMRERAALLGGSVELGASPIGGTRVTARLPWSDAV